MVRYGRTGQVLCAIGGGLFALALVAGVFQSLRVDHRLPAIDLFGNGSKAYVNGLLAKKDYDGAIKQLRMQTRLLPFESASYEYLGNVLGGQGRPEEARAQFLDLVRLRPDYAEGYSYIGSTYLDTGDPASAATYFAKAIRIKPDFPFAHNRLGLAMAQQGRLQEAEKHFAKAVELAPEYEEARRNLERARRELGDRR